MSATALLPSVEQRALYGTVGAVDRGGIGRTMAQAFAERFSMELRLDGRRVVITAAAAGIGRATLETFVTAGARVCVCDVDAQELELLRAALPEVGAMIADVSDPAAVDALFDMALARLGGLDILINNAGIAGPTAPIEAIEPEDWARTLEVNLTGQYLCARRAVPHIRAAGGGSIVNLSSAAGRFGFALRTPYAASKWAVIGLTKSLAIELGADQIRVNAICPGAVEGERIERVIAAKAQALGITYETMHAQIVEKASMKRMVSPKDIADMILYLCSDAGRLVSGQAIGVDGNVEYLR
jgi:NAD(P)-dependent dehydrogenase (short-subunit alcohol dehydrogenase family)